MGRETFSSAVMDEIRLNVWNTKPLIRPSHYMSTHDGRLDAETGAHLSQAQLGKLLVGGVGRDALLANGDFAFGGLVDRADDVEHRRLAAAALAQDHHELAATYPHVHACTQRQQCTAGDKAGSDAPRNAGTPSTPSKYVL